MTQGNIYFDYNATTPLDAEVLEMAPSWLNHWGNPSSIHLHGRGPKKLLREARRSFAESLQCHPLELVFTSGGSEANNLALRGFLQEIKIKEPQRNKVLIGSIEHPSIIKQIPEIQKMGFEVETLPVDRSGRYDLEVYQSLLGPSVALVSVMFANNEIGVIAPLQEMVPLAKQQGTYFHSDLVQCLGKHPFDLKELGVDMASFSSHKVYAMKGAGALFVKKGTPMSPLILGGAQERGRRAGTENLAAIASFAHMVQGLNSVELSTQMSALRDSFEAWVVQHIQGVEILGSQVPRLSNTSCLTLKGVNGESLLMNLDIRGFSVGTGAACSSGNPEPSPVLLGIGLSRDEAQSSLRISLGKNTTQEEVLALGQNLKDVVDHLRKLEEGCHV